MGTLLRIILLPEDAASARLTPRVAFASGLLAVLVDCSSFSRGPGRV